MSASSHGRPSFVSRFLFGSRRMGPFLVLPIAVTVLTAALAFRPVPVQPQSEINPLVLPQGWAPPPVPYNNPITNEKFVLGRQLFYAKELSADGQTSCGTCHDQALAFGAGGPHAGSNDIQSRPIRMVMRLANVGYDTVLTWDGHIQTLEEQVAIAIQKKGDLNQPDTAAAFAKLAENPAYIQMFKNAFGDGQITMDRISKAVATFERCLISGNSTYDQYLNGTAELSQSALHGMKLFFDTGSTNCSECHNNLGSQGNTSNNIFTDNNYYRTGTFEFSPSVKGGYGMDSTQDTTQDTTIREDAGRAAVTRDTSDIGKFRTPSLRNSALMGKNYGADGTVDSLITVIENYNNGGSNTTDGGKTFFSKISNQDPHIKKLNLSTTDMSDIRAFLNDLTDLSFITNPAFHDPGDATMSVDDHVIGENISLYPNPSVGSVNIECPNFTGLTDVSVIDASGNTVWNESVMANGKLQLDLSQVRNGSYRVRLHSATNQQIIPFVLSR